jgi:hypothetical protein
MCNTTDEYPKGYVSVNSRDGLAMYSINRNAGIVLLIVKVFC